MVKNAGRIAALGLLSLLSGSVVAQSERSAPEEYASIVKKGQDISALGTSLFGDQTALYSGTVEFQATDLSLPGNSALPVSFGRRFVVEDRHQDGYLGGLGNWDIDVPYMSGTFAKKTGWISGGPNRCSVTSSLQAAPPSVSTSVLWPEDPAQLGAPFDAEYYFHGYQVHVPGHGDQDLIYRTSATSAGGLSTTTYPWMLKDYSVVGCTPMVDGTSGEGFVVTSPDGVRTKFNYTITRTAASLVKARILPSGNTGGSAVDPGDAGTSPRPSDDPHHDVLERSKVFLVATEMTDRYGNWVKFNYTGDQLSSIEANDGRKLTVAYGSDGTGCISSVSTINGTSTQTWLYQCSRDIKGMVWLSSVTLPDSSQWLYNQANTSDNGVALLLNVDYETPPLQTQSQCFLGSPRPETFTYSATSPSGASGVFHFTASRRARSFLNYDASCRLLTGTVGSFRFPPFVDAFTLDTKTISGPGLAAMTWSTTSVEVDSHSPNPGCIWDFATSQCTGTRDVNVVAPDGTTTVTTFGTHFQMNEGQLLRSRLYSASSELVRDTSTSYVCTDQTSQNCATTPFPATLGYSPRGSGDAFGVTAVRPEKTTSTVQDGVTFSRVNNAYNEYAVPTSVTRSNSLGATRTDLITLYNDTALWVLNQMASVQDSATLAYPVQNTFNAKADVSTVTHFGLLQRSFAYNADGTLSTVTDPLSHITTYTNWRRGLPQNVLYADTRSESIVVADRGWIDSWTSAANITTGYSHDKLGRLTAITPPAGWNATSLTFRKLLGTEATATGLTTANWRQSITTGLGTKEIYFDALWRPVLTTQYDAGNRVGTLRSTVKGYDLAGHENYVSYPVAASPLYSNHGNPGVVSAYDALGRLGVTQADSELGPLFTDIQYQSGFVKSVTDPRGVETTTTYQVFDEPSEDAPLSIALDAPVKTVKGGVVTYQYSPESTQIDIVRDLFGKAKSITRHAAAPVRGGGTAVTSTRSYVYDANQRLCVATDPETGSTAMDYDAAGNIAWTASGLSLSAPVQCNRAAVASNLRATHGYDARNRPTSIAYPDNVANWGRTYTADGLVDSASAGAVVWNYAYNTLRLPFTETLNLGGTTYQLENAYSTNGHLASVKYPDLSVVDFAPNALGEPTKAGTFASGVTRYPNGAIHAFSYGNAISHSMTQNTRGLPAESVDTGVLDDVYTYDANANVVAIADNALHVADRTMGYDSLNRLTSTNAPNLWGSALYTYDALDNMLTSKAGARTYTHVYDTVTNRLTALKRDGSIVMAYGYDSQGNVTQRGAQQFVFDKANRMSRGSGRVASDSETYAYDGWGRRVSATVPGGTQRTMLYSQSGELRYEADSAANTATNYIYLGGTLVARQDSAPPTLPAPPTVTAPATNTTGSYTVSWSVSQGATRYVMQESANGGAWITQYDGAAQSLALTGRTNGSYKYAATACNEVGCSAFSTPVTTVVTGVPAPVAPAVPVSITASPTTSATGNYTVAWTASTGATTYTVQEKIGAGAWVTYYQGASTTLNVTGRANGTYSYQVSACNQLCSAYTATPATVTVSIVVVPSGQLTLTLPSTSSTGSYAASWNAVSTATSYQLQEQLGSGTWTTVYSGAALTYSLSGRSNGVYSYQARACNAAGCGDYSAIKSTTVSIPTIPSPTTLTITTTGPNSYTLTWSSATTATRYEVDKSVNGGGTWTLDYSGANLSLVVTNQANGTYQYRARSCNSAGCSANTNVKQVVVGPPVITVPASSSTGNYSVSWTAVAGANGYRLEESVNGGSWIELPLGTVTTTYNVVGHASGTYGYRVKACGTDCTTGIYSTNTASIVVTLQNSISAPTGVTGPGGTLTGLSSYTIQWNAVTNATGYKVEEVNPCGPTTTTFDVATTSKQFTHGTQCNGVTFPSTDFKYRVQACINTDCSAWSEPAVHVLIVKATGPARPASTVITTRYLHTDALGSPVATTDAQGQLISRSRYEPYGAPADGVYQNGPGFTGHETDGWTGLTYMQQRYYDPIAARFLSMDPSEVEKATASNFNRYVYADNSPYGGIDPDGRDVAILGNPAYTTKVRADLSKLKATPSGKSIVESLEKSPFVNVIKSPEQGRLTVNSTNPAIPSDANNGKGSDTVIRYNPDNRVGGEDDKGNTDRPPPVALAHEMGHANAINEGKQSDDKGLDAKGKPVPSTTPPSEKESMKAENGVRADMGKTLRSNYYPKKVDGT